MEGPWGRTRWTSSRHPEGSRGGGGEKRERIGGEKERKSLTGCVSRRLENVGNGHNDGPRMKGRDARGMVVVSYQTLGFQTSAVIS